MNWTKFTFAALKFTIEFQDNFQMPEFLGNTLRGGFGQVLHHSVCPYKKTDCYTCFYKDSCVYAYIFNSVFSKRLQAAKKMKNYPSPFTIDPPFNNKSYYKKGKTLEFEIIIAGKAVDYLQYFITGFKKLGSKGIGKHYSKYKLLKVVSAYDPSTILYDAESQLVQANHLITSFDDYLNQSENTTDQVDTIEIEFLSRTRFQKNYDNETKPGNFEVLIDHIMERMTLLSELYCDYQPDIQKDTILTEACSVKTAQQDLDWEDVDYTSGTSKRKYWYGGFTGKIQFSGDLSSFVPLLRFGEVFHVGHGTTRGYGKYKLFL